MDLLKGINMYGWIKNYRNKTSPEGFEPPSIGFYFDIRSQRHYPGYATGPTYKIIIEFINF